MQLYIKGNGNDGKINIRRTCEARVSLSRTARLVGGGQRILRYLLNRCPVRLNYLTLERMNT